MRRETQIQTKLPTSHCYTLLSSVMRDLGRYWIERVVCHGGGERLVQIWKKECLVNCKEFNILLQCTLRELSPNYPLWPLLVVVELLFSNLMTHVGWEWAKTLPHFFH